MRALRATVLGVDGALLLAVLLIRLAFPGDPGQGGEGPFWAGLLMAYALILLSGLMLVLNAAYVIALGIMRRRYENGYGRLSRALVFLLPAATVLGLTIH